VAAELYKTLRAAEVVPGVKGIVVSCHKFLRPSELSAEDEAVSQQSDLAFAIMDKVVPFTALRRRCCTFAHAACRCFAPQKALKFCSPNDLRFCSPNDLQTAALVSPNDLQTAALVSPPHFRRCRVHRAQQCTQAAALDVRPVASGAVCAWPTGDMQ
jgi:hypothetical protein